MCILQCQVPTIKALAMQQVTGQLCTEQSATRQSASAHCVLFACHYHRIVHDVPLTTQKWPRRWCLVLHCLHHGLFNLSQAFAARRNSGVVSLPSACTKEDTIFSRYSTYVKRYRLLFKRYSRQKILSCQKIRSSKDIIFKR